VNQGAWLRRMSATETLKDEPGADASFRLTTKARMENG
jgi:hypothetical protein